jgi:RNA polymerase sigma factor (sigma-70 family)
MRATFSKHYDQRTEATLIEAFYQGEDVALSILSERLRPQLTGLALSRLPHTEVGRYQLAEDLVQDTFIKVATTKGRPQSRWQTGKSTVSTWIGTILKNLIHSHLRTRKNRIRVTTDLWSETGTDDKERIENNLIDHRLLKEQQICSAENERSNWLRAVASLPQEFHTLITMQLEGKSHREIASQLGISRSTVTYRIKNATKLLRRVAAA